MEVRTQEEFDRAKQFLREIGYFWFWLGGSDREVEGEWRWESNDELIDMNKFWGSGQPDSYAGDQDCLFFMWRDGFGDLDCSRLRQFACEFD